MASKDKVAPTLAVTTPKKGGNAVAVNQNLVLIFNENIQVGTGNIVISNGKGDEQTISMISSPSQYAIIGKTLVINPARDLLPNTHYSVKIDRNAIADLSGNKYAGIDNATTLSFDTVDTLAPFLLSSSSTIKQNGIAPSDNISLTFSEKIQAGRGNITLVAGNDSRTIPISDKQITISGNTLIFNPSADFNVNSSYALHLDAGAINDAALTPNAISAIDLNFKTLVNGDKQAPVLQKYSGKGEVSDNLQLVFQEPIKLGKGNFTLNDGTTQIIIPASDTKQVSIQNNVLTINPSQNLNPEKMYTLISPKGILTDIVGNAFAGLSTRNAFSFDTHDITSPTLIITDDKGALTNSSILYTFTLSEASNNFTSADILVTGGTKGQFLELSPTIYSLHVTPEMDSLMPVKVNVAAKVFTDLVGNDNVAAQQNSQAVDTVAPTVIISAEKPVSLNSAVTYTFTLSEASQTFSADIITVTGAEKGVFKALNSTIYSLNVVPNANSITPINVEVASGEFTDFAGNGNIGSEKASQAIDTLAPTL
ncbi:MAG: Ig-like domain-containing protein, partial [Methylococcaceae bacterium]